MKTVAFDWSAKGIDVTFDGIESERMPDLDALLTRLTKPYRIVGEASFESYLPEKREKFMKDCEAAGHELFVFHPKYTDRLRTKLGIEKTDANDSLVIWRIAVDGQIHLRRAKTTNKEWADFNHSVNHDHTIGRYSGEVPEMVAEFEAVFGKPKELTEIQKLVFLTKGGTWREHLVAAILRASKNAPNRDVFERLTGMYANGYGSHLRSDVTWWGYVGGRAGLTAGPRMSWSDFRREIRKAYHVLRSSQGMRAPEKGITVPV